MKKPFHQNLPRLGALFALATILAGVVFFRYTRTPAAASTRTPGNSLVAQLADQQYTSIPLSYQRKLALDSTITAGPSLVEAEQIAASMNLFAPRSLAIVPQEWPQARMKFVIGATAVVHEAQSDLPFQARVDTGAHTCSLHVEEFVIRDAAEAMEKNVGKEIRFRVINHEGASEWIESTVDACAQVRTSDHIEDRYKVPIAFRWNDFERLVLVTLNNRTGMNYPLLLGRNFLQSDFVVDVALDGE